MKKLAINGGNKLRTEPFPAYNTINAEEEKAVLRVLKSGKLSTYLGAWHDDFYGGTEVQKLESEWAEYFNVKHAISVNSATSGLYAAVGAIGINPGDEVIVSAYTMSASATAILIYGGIPVFADIEEDYFCLDVNSIKEKITSKTKAIMVVDIFGQPYDANAINALAKEHNLKIIEDTAQAPNAMYGDKYAGTLGDIGVFSLNYHKHIHCGEGGIIVTNDDEFAFKLQLIRNHAEAVIGTKGYENKNELINMVGFNYRMTEIDAAIAREQLKKLPLLSKQRSENVEYLNSRISQIPAISGSKVRKNSTHAYYAHAMTYDLELANEIHRNKFIDAVAAELPNTILREDSPVLVGCGYVKPLYLLPMYQEKIAFGKDGYPFNLSTNTNYNKGICSVTEDMHYNKLFSHEFMRPGMTKKDMGDVVNAFEKVWTYRDELC
jgi:dTDP-4-amino-4,6-dideoxygalactose transaminase